MEANLRYTNEILAWEYDQRNPMPEPGEIEWYRKYTSKAGGPVLELACGSGRILLPLLIAGYDVDGVDSSNAMLDRLKQRLPDSLRSKLRLFGTDILSFIPDQMYGVIVLGYNSVQYLGTSAQIRDAFTRSWQWLRPGGYFLLMISRVDINKFAEGRRVVVDWLDKPAVDSRTGLSVGSKTVTYLDASSKVFIKERRYPIERPGDAAPTIIDDITKSPVLVIDEYDILLRDQGYETKVYGGYDESPDNGISRRVCIVAHKPPHG